MRPGNKKPAVSRGRKRLKDLARRNCGSLLEEVGTGLDSVRDTEAALMVGNAKTSISANSAQRHPKWGSHRADRRDDE